MTRRHTMDTTIPAPERLPVGDGKPSSSKSRKPQKPQKPRNTFVNISAEQASGTKVSLSAHSIASEIYLDRLTLTKEQLSEII
jgi:hypothetical protein